MNTCTYYIQIYVDIYIIKIKIFVLNISIICLSDIQSQMILEVSLEEVGGRKCKT